MSAYANSGRYRHLRISGQVKTNAYAALANDAANCDGHVAFREL